MLQISIQFFNFLEKNKICFGNDELVKKILICLFPLLPNLSSSIYKKLFEDIKYQEWPMVNKDLLEDNKINFPIQIDGKLVQLFSIQKKAIMKKIY